MKPLIDIFADVDDDRISGIKFPYVSAIENSGCIPVLIPYTEKDETVDFLIELCHGFLFSGGPDVDPIRYGEERKSTCGIVYSCRDDHELRAYQWHPERLRAIDADNQRIFEDFAAACRASQLDC